MIEGVFGICPSCGEEMHVATHVRGAHTSEENQSEIHLAWIHATCNIFGEIKITANDYLSALSVSKRYAGEDVELVESDGDEEMRLFKNVLARTSTIESIEAWVS